MFEPRKITRVEAQRAGYSWPLFSKTKLLTVFAICVAFGVVASMISFKAIFYDWSMIISRIVY